MSKQKKFIQGMDLNTGSLTAKAKAANKTIIEFCAGSNLDETTKKQCVLARTFRSFNK